jgi:RHS repeat-associated protein
VPPRYLNGAGGGLGLSVDNTGTVQLQLANLHGDVVATCNSTDTRPATYSDTTEYGLPRTPTTARYGWLGTHHRDTGDALAQLTLMGARLYNPTTGRFLSTDPEPGGSANDYDYCAADPINCTDLDGRWPSWHSVRHAVWKYKWDIAGAALSFVPVAGEAVWAYRGYRAYRVYKEYRAIRAARSIGRAIRYGARYVRRGYETKIGKNWRIAPFGNRVGKWYNRLPHYHRRGTGPGQGIGRHRPWQSSEHDRS